MTSDTSNTAPGLEPDGTQRSLPPHTPGFKASPRVLYAGIAVAVLALGVAGGAGAQRYVQKGPQSVLLLEPAPIAQMSDTKAVAIKGEVSEIFGNKFIIQDDSGRALVETGPRGEGGKMVTKGEAVTVQGRFEKGFIHAQVIKRADGSTEAFGPPKPPRHERGPDAGPGREPPPPPPRPRD